MLLIEVANNALASQLALTEKWKPVSPRSKVEKPRSRYSNQQLMVDEQRIGRESQAHADDDKFASVAKPFHFRECWSAVLRS